MVYVQGMMAPVASEKKAQYQTLSAKAADVFRQNGALSVVESWGDDIPDGKVNDMKSAVKLKDGETPVFTWIVWPSKAARDEGMQKSFANPLFSEGFDPGMDGARMFFGGFETIIEAGDFSGADYIDGFLVPCLVKNKEAYRKMAADAWPLFERHGAISMFECWQDDLPDGQLTSMALAVQKKPDEAVLFSWVGWPSKEARLKGQASMMADPEMRPPPEMPFDGMRMIFGGFEVIVDR